VAAGGFAIVQGLTALWMYGKLGGAAPGWAGPLRRTTGVIAFLLTLPVAFHCLWARGFQTTDARVVAHSLLGCVFYGAFVASWRSPVPAPPGTWPPSACRAEPAATRYRSYSVPKLNTVLLWNSCPGRSTVDGKAGWLGESGKCCVSRANPSLWR
jgi:hypothetical protein